MRPLYAYIFALLCAQFLAVAAFAQAGTGTHALDGTSVEWSYNTSDARMVVSFAGGLGQYERIAGGRAGHSDAAIPYSSREISPNIFLMSWVQADRPDFITMIFDFNAMTIATTGLIGFDQSDYRQLFMDSVSIVSSAEARGCVERGLDTQVLQVLLSAIGPHLVSNVFAPRDNRQN